MSILQSSKMMVMQVSGLSKDALHVYVGLGVMLIGAIVLRKGLRDWRLLAAVGVAALAGEAWDLIDTLVQGEPVRLRGNWKDVWNTLFWPVVLFALARFTRVLKARRPLRAALRTAAGRRCSHGRARTPARGAASARAHCRNR